MKKYDRLLNILLVGVIIFHLLISPFTKVEESFNLQAIHDIVNYGIAPQDTILKNYDHIEFPGVVPRTFLGSLFISAIIVSVKKVFEVIGVELAADGTQLNFQLMSRAILGLLNAYCLISLKNSANKISLKYKKSKYEGLVGVWFMLLLLTQFHLLYYASRTLPNFIALPLVCIALSKILEGNMYGLALLSFTAVILRMEVGVFAVLIASVSSLFGQSSIVLNFTMLAGGTILGVFSSLIVDSYFWNSWMVPEVASFIFNIVNGKSTDWGVEPWSAYFYKYIGQIYSPIFAFLTVYGLVSDPVTMQVQKQKQNSMKHPAKNSLRILFISSILYVSCMSFQPHKEWRFIIYVIPVFTLQAANALTELSINPTMYKKLVVLFLVVSIIFTSILSLFKGYASSYNYPGGNALGYVNKYIIENNYTDVKLHADVASCMSGISKFGELKTNNITYDRTENKDELLNILKEVDFLITEVPSSPDGSWELIHISEKYEGISIYPITELIQMQKRDSSTLKNFLLSVIKELQSGNMNTLNRLLESVIVRNDYLYVYKNKSRLS